MRKTIWLVVMIMSLTGLSVNAATSTVSPKVSLVSVSGSEITVKLEVTRFNGVSNESAVPAIIEGPNASVKCTLTAPDGTETPIVSVRKTTDNLLVFDAGIILDEGQYTLSCDARLVKLKWATYSSWDYDPIFNERYNNAFTLKNITLTPTEMGTDPSLESNYVQDGLYVDVLLSIKLSETSGWEETPVMSILDASGVTITDPEGNPVEIEEVTVGDAFSTPSLRVKIKGPVIDGEYRLSVAKNSIAITSKSVGNPPFDIALTLQGETLPEPEPTSLRVSSPDNHAYVVTCPENHSATVTFYPSKGWVVASVLYNDNDVTNDCEGNTYVTPPMTGSNHLQIVMKEDITSYVKEVSVSIPVLSVVNQTLHIGNVSDDEMLEVYDSNGICVYSGKVRSLPLSPGKTYLARICGGVYKFYVS